MLLNIFLQFRLIRFVTSRSDSFSSEKWETDKRAFFFKVCGHRCMQLGVLKADTQVNPSRKLEQWSSPLIFILPSSTRTEPLKSTPAVSWMKFSSLHLPDRRRFVLWLRELLWVLWFYCPPDDCSHNSSAFAHTFNTHGHKKHNTPGKVQHDAIYFHPSSTLCTVYRLPQSFNGIC